MQIYQYATLGQTVLFFFKFECVRVPKDLRDRDSRHEETRAQQAVHYAQVVFTSSQQNWNKNLFLRCFVLSLARNYYFCNEGRRKANLMLLKGSSSQCHPIEINMACVYNIKIFSSYIKNKKKQVKKGEKMKLLLTIVQFNPLYPK